MTLSPPDLPTACPLCQETGGLLLVQAPAFRVVRVADAHFPAFYRVIWQAHRAELSELTPAERQLCMDAVVRVEQVLRQSLQPTKINLAALGNMVPHLHWHVIARFEWDSHFPQPIWGPTQRAVEPPAEARLAISLATLDERVMAAFA